MNLDALITELEGRARNERDPEALEQLKLRLRSARLLRSWERGLTVKQARRAAR